MAVLLNNHSKVYIPSKSYLGSFLASWNSYIYQVSRNINSSFGESLFKINRISEAFLKLGIDKSSINTRGDLNSVLEGWAKSNKKSIWGDKAPPFIDSLDKILFLFPSAKIIHLIRDPRPNATSLSKRQYLNLFDATYLWNNLNSSGIANGKLIGKDQYLKIKYEDLISNPEVTLNSVCDFVGIEFEEQMLLKLSNQKGDNYVANKIDSKKIDTWKTSMSKKDIITIEKIIGKNLSRNGYQNEALIDQNRFDKKQEYTRKQFLYKVSSFGKYFIKSRKEIMTGRKIEIEHQSFLYRLKRLIVDYTRAVFSQDFINFIKGKDHRS